MHDACTINLYFHIDSCEHNAWITFPTSVRLAQAHPNYNYGTEIILLPTGMNNKTDV